MRSFSIVPFFLLVIIVASCFLDKRPKDVDSFYFSRNYGQFPLLPLSNPVVSYYDKMDDNWNIDMLDYNFNRIIDIQSLNSIGVYKAFIYGKLHDEEKWDVKKYKRGDYVYAHRYGGTTLSKEPYKSQDDIRVYPVDSTSNTFVLPERWFVINVADSTAEAFFLKKKYQNYLKQKGISGEMYNINKYHKQYKETGIVPWFPDSIKVKLRK